MADSKGIPNPFTVAGGLPPFDNEGQPGMPSVAENGLLAEILDQARHGTTKMVAELIEQRVLQPLGEKMAAIGEIVGYAPEIGSHCSYSEDGSERVFLFLNGEKAVQVTVNALEGDDAAKARDLFKTQQEAS